MNNKLTVMPFLLALTRQGRRIFARLTLTLLVQLKDYETISELPGAERLSFRTGLLSLSESVKVRHYILLLQIVSYLQYENVITCQSNYHLSRQLSNHIVYYILEARLVMRITLIMNEFYIFQYRTFHIFDEVSVGKCNYFSVPSPNVMSQVNMQH